MEMEKEEQKVDDLQHFSKQKAGSLDGYQVGKLLGEGYTSEIRLGYEPNKQQKVALKILKDGNDFSLDKTVQAEVSALSNLNHPNILKLFKAAQNAKYVDEKGSQKSVTYMSIELGEGGELFDFVANTGIFQKEICRYYFQQIIGALEYCHSKGYAHRDLKPENLLFSKEFQVKLADFGFAKLMDGGKMKTYLGTASYMAPEIHNHEKYDGAEVDLFATAVILFIMYTGTPPFGQATTSDPYYKILCLNKQKTFWAAHARSKPGRHAFFEKDFKDLIERMFKQDPKDRLTIEQIKKHPWYNGQVASKEQVQQEFTRRFQAVQKEQERERQAKIKQLKINKAQDQTQMDKAYGGVGNFRDVPEELVKQFEMADIQQNLDKKFPDWNKKDRLINDFEEEGAGLHAHYLKVDETDLLEFLLAVLQKDEYCSDLELDEKLYRITGNFKCEMGDVRLSMSIAQYKKDQDIKVIEFHKVGGNLMNYYSKIRQIKDNFLKPIAEHYEYQEC